LKRPPGITLQERLNRKPIPPPYKRDWIITTVGLYVDPPERWGFGTMIVSSAFSLMALIALALVRPATG
jgi:hypothetical protein